LARMRLAVLVGMCIRALAAALEYLISMREHSILLFL
jgi:hypothetical protein